MQQSEQEGIERDNREMAYRRGYQSGTQDGGRLALELIELGYKAREVKRLFAVFDDHFLAPWRQGDLSQREAPPPFEIDRCLAILEATTGYDWIV